MAAAAVVHLVRAASSQSSQKKRIPAVLQTDAGTERPAPHHTLYRYNSHSMFVDRYIYIDKWEKCGSS